MELLDECAREKAGMGEDWSPYSYKCLPEYPQEAEMVEVIGAVAPLKTRGKNKGNRNWSKMDLATIRTVYVTFRENAEYVKAWEAKTGLCATCRGSTKESCGWSVTEGVRYMVCSKCRGTGKANVQSEGSPPSRLENKQERNGDSLH